MDGSVLRARGLTKVSGAHPEMVRATDGTDLLPLGSLDAGREVGCFSPPRPALPRTGPAPGSSYSAAFGLAAADTARPNLKDR